MLIVWDKCRVDHKATTDVLDRKLQDLRHHNQLMGGVTRVLVRDFH